MYLRLALLTHQTILFKTAPQRNKESNYIVLETNKMKFRAKNVAQELKKIHVYLSCPDSKVKALLRYVNLIHSFLVGQNQHLPFR